MTTGQLVLSRSQNNCDLRIVISESKLASQMGYMQTSSCQSFVVESLTEQSGESHFFDFFFAEPLGSFFDRSLRESETISIALMAASNPLLPVFRPARSMACSRVSQVRTP